LSFGTVNEESDIDLFVVAKKGRLFIVRSFVTFLFQVLGVRRHGNKTSARFCLSFFVDDESMDLSEIAIENDIYLAVWTESLVPVIDDGVFEEFKRGNQWIGKFLGPVNFRRSRLILNNGFYGFLGGVFEFLLRGRLGNFIERKLMGWQLRRSRKKAKQVDVDASLIVSEGILKFHNLDRRRLYRRRWFESYGNSPIDRSRFLEIVRSSRSSV